MVKIELSIPRPGMLVAMLLGVSGWALWLNASAGQGSGAAMKADLLSAQNVLVEAKTETVNSGILVPAKTTTPAASTTAQTYPLWQAVGRDAFSTSGVQGGPVDPTLRARKAEDNAQMLRVQQTLLHKKTELLKQELLGLELERRERGDVLTDQELEEFRQAAAELASRVQDEQKADDFIKESIKEMWEARSEVTDKLPPSTDGMEIPNFHWPVPKSLGISAYFHDPDYPFAMTHEGIDLKARKGTPIVAAADGIVEKVVDNGNGFNYILIGHGEHFKTMYGHPNRILVVEGQAVLQGDIIGYSDGRPGDPGAGLSTGEHLHYEMRIDGVPVDPLKYMPPL